ncbi:hypothetical protein LUZ60_015099 [Juncus effusus]|nr:hypothetical protein LUZ60_015099 [Juncus effusus]
MFGSGRNSSSSTSRTDTTGRTISSTDYSNISSVSTNRSSTSGSLSGRRRNKNMSTLLLKCLGLEPDDFINLPNSSLEGSERRGSLSGKKFLYKQSSFQVISEHVRFTLDEILNATNHFSEDLKIGQGGCSVVYKGRLHDGKYVAVKRATKNVDEERLTEESFTNEIKTLQQISHLSLVVFYGFLVFEDEQIIVVEYVPNGNLRQHLDCQFGKVLEFSNRLDIIIDVAHAITYLHTYCDTPIIHRDIKSSNILLTESLHAKVADFGLAKLNSNDEDSTFIHTVAKGTPGYIDPEYFKTNQLTEKSDVYSYGVVLIEIVTGKHPLDRVDKCRTVKWAMNEALNGNAIRTIDPNLILNPAMNLAVERIYELAYHCLNMDRKKRPSMEECGKILWNVRKSYNDSNS